MISEEEVVVEEDNDQEDIVEETNDDSESFEDEVQEEESPESEHEEEDEEDRVVIIEGNEEKEEPKTPGWVKTVRKANRRLESENRRLRRELQERSTEKTPVIQVGEKPTLKSVGYDDKKYEEALTSYYERKRQSEQQEAEKEKIIEEQNQNWQRRQERYVKKRAEHGFKDFTEVEELVSSTLSITQQGIIVQGAEDSALVVYGLGKNEKVLEELAKITDPVEFAFRVAKLESQLKVTSKKAPKPEKRINGGKAGGLSGTADSTLDRLRAEAEKTGDYTKVMAYKRSKRKK